jgi:F-type H+-transporting ATPase subunit delta
VSDPAAAVYADALFAAAEEAGSLERVGRDLDDLVGELVSSPVLTRVLFNPAVAPEGKANVLRRLTDDADPLVTRTLLLLLENGRLGLMPDLQQAFGERYGVAARKLDVQLTTAVEVDEAQAERLRQQLERSTGQSVTLKRVVDPSILGGVVLRVADLLVDASVRRRLESLRRTLQSTRLPA